MGAFPLGQQDRHERNKRQNDGSRSAPQYQKGQQVVSAVPEGQLPRWAGMHKVHQGEQRAVHHRDGDDDNVWRNYL